MFAAEADVVASNNFLIRRHRHSSGDVARGGGGKVLYFLKEAWGFAGGHFFCGVWGRRREPRDFWIEFAVCVNRPLVAVLCDNARHHLVKCVATLKAAGFKVRAMAGGHGSALKLSVAEVV